MDMVAIWYGRVDEPPQLHASKKGAALTLMQESEQKG
jgi:hypothetical protein